MAAPVKLSRGVSELDFVGAIRGEPLEVITSDLTGLPIPAYAEIVVEGEIPPITDDSAHEGPFGDWPGYYTHEGDECVVRVKRILHRTRPIILGNPPLLPITQRYGVPIHVVRVWEHLEGAGIANIRGVWTHINNLLVVISLKQAFPGHASHALIAAAGLHYGPGMDTYYVVVDDDIDPSNLHEVLWAMCTRCDPAKQVQILTSYTQGLDPRLSPEQKEVRRSHDGAHADRRMPPVHVARAVSATQPLRRRLPRRSLEEMGRAARGGREERSGGGAMMLLLRRHVAFVISVLLTSSLAIAAPPSGTPLAIPTILPLTGPGAFIGQEQVQALKGVEATVNASGGIGGHPVTFDISDDQSNPQVALQLVEGLRAKGVPLILGPTWAASCSAVLPVADKDGPVVYCLSNSIRPSAGSYVFSSLFSTNDMLVAAMRYFRQRGWKRVAYITAVDATGQDAERAITNALALPENKDLVVVDREHFANADISDAAQMIKIKAADPQVLIAWAAGTPGGTLLRGANDAGLDVPTLTSPANLNFNVLKTQWAAFLPTHLIFPGSASAVCPAPQTIVVGKRWSQRSSKDWDPA